MPPQTHPLGGSSTHAFLKPKPKTPSLKPKEKANLFEKKKLIFEKKNKKNDALIENRTRNLCMLTAVRTH